MTSTYSSVIEPGLLNVNVEFIPFRKSQVEDGEIQNNTYLHLPTSLLFQDIHILYYIDYNISKKFSKIFQWPLLVLSLQWLVHNWCFGSSDSLLPYYYIIHTRRTPTNGASSENTYTEEERLVVMQEDKTSSIPIPSPLL